jgi:hypothetical protein
MITVLGGARAALLAAAVSSACNGQFDFDTWVDASTPPVVIEGGFDHVSSASDAIADTNRGAVRIACGASDCLSSGCCSRSTGTSCVDTAEGGTCGGLLIQCDDTDDCPSGQVCCAEGENLNHPPCTSDVCNDSRRLLRVHCEPEARCKGDFVMLCNPERPSPCAQCFASPLAGLPPGYHQCAAAP